MLDHAKCTFQASCTCCSPISCWSLAWWVSSPEGSSKSTCKKTLPGRKAPLVVGAGASHIIIRRYICHKDHKDHKARIRAVMFVPKHHMNHVIHVAVFSSSPKGAEDSEPTLWPGSLAYESRSVGVVGLRGQLIGLCTPCSMDGRRLSSEPPDVDRDPPGFPKQLLLGWHPRIPSCETSSTRGTELSARRRFRQARTEFRSEWE